MSDVTVITPGSLSEAKDLASTLAQARTLPQALQKAPADVLAIILAGAELGLAPMQSLRGIVLIDGRPTLSADAMGALVKSRRDVCAYLVLEYSDATRATYRTQRVGDPQPTTMTFTIEDAQRAGLRGSAWQRYPAAMLRARALSAICRAVYPDLLLGVYDPEELEARLDIPPPTERDVTPTASAQSTPTPPPASPPRRKRHMLQTETGEVVPLGGGTRRTEDGTSGATGAVATTPGRTPWDDICAAAREAGVPWRHGADWLRARGRGRPSEVRPEDVEEYRALLAREMAAAGAGGES